MECVLVSVGNQVYPTSLSSSQFENPSINWISQDMPLNVLVTEHAVGVNVFDNANKVVEAGIQFAKRVSTKVVRFCPMRSSLMP